MTQILTQSDLVVYVVCPHTNRAVEAYGNIAYTGGDVLDTTEEHLVCTDCGAYLDEPELETEIPF